MQVFLKVVLWYGSSQIPWPKDQDCTFLPLLGVLKLVYVGYNYWLLPQ